MVWNLFKVNNTGTNVIHVDLLSLLLILNMFLIFSVSIVDSEQVNICLVTFKNSYKIYLLEVSARLWYHLTFEKPILNWNDTSIYQTIILI